MSSYSLNLRERIVRAVEQGESKTAVSQRFCVSLSTVKRYVKWRAEGKLTPRQGSGRKRLLDAHGCEVLQEQVTAHHDWSVERHAQELTKARGVEIKKSSVGNYLKRLGITHKIGPKALGLVLKKRALSPANEMNEHEMST